MTTSRVTSNGVTFMGHLNLRPQLHGPYDFVVVDFRFCDAQPEMEVLAKTLKGRVEFDAVVTQEAVALLTCSNSLLLSAILYFHISTAKNTKQF